MTPVTASGAVRLLPCCTAPTSHPITTAKPAGSNPRRISTVHHALASAASACGSTENNFHSFRARKRSIVTGRE